MLSREMDFMPSDQTRKMIHLFSVFMVIGLSASITSVSSLSPAEANVTSVSLNTSLHNETSTPTMKDNDDDSNTGSVVAGVVICIVLIIALVAAILIFRKRQQSRNMDNEKKMQIQMTSARNAGVYHDLTVSVPADEKPAASPEHEKLKPSDEA